MYGDSISPHPIQGATLRCSTGGCDKKVFPLPLICRQSGGTLARTRDCCKTDCMLLKKERRRRRESLAKRSNSILSGITWQLGTFVFSLVWSCCGWCGTVPSSSNLPFNDGEGPSSLAPPLLLLLQRRPSPLPSPSVECHACFAFAHPYSMYVRPFQS